MIEQNPYVFDSIASAYDSTRSFPPDVMEKVISKLHAHLGDRRPVLDIGVGTGRFAAPLAKLGVNMVGIDLAKNMMSKAREKGFGNLLMASATDLPFQDDAFESATMVHVLHLIPDWHRALSELSRTVRGSLYTVATVTEKLHEPRAIYERRLEEQGYGRAYLGMPEKELPKRIAPDEEEHVCNHDVTMPTDLYIGNLERREYSWATRLPDDKHKAVVEEIRRALGGTTETVRGRITIYRWKASRLASVPN